MKTLLQQALDALLTSNPHDDFPIEYAQHFAVIEALKAELAKPEPEPYAWVFVPHNELLWPDEVEHKTPCEATGYIPLYTKGTTNV